MMKKLITAFALATMMTLPVAGYAEKIGFVNVNRLFSEYAKAKGIDKMIENRFSGPKKELDKLVSDIKTLEKEIKTNELLMSESKLKASKEKLAGMIGQYREKGAALEKDLQEVRNREMSSFRNIVIEVTREFATENKYDLIINEGVMFAADKINITDEILARVNKKAK